MITGKKYASPNDVLSLEKNPSVYSQAQPYLEGMRKATALFISYST